LIVSFWQAPKTSPTVEKDNNNKPIKNRYFKIGFLKIILLMSYITKSKNAITPRLIRLMDLPP
jgi:hypothetical protein